MFIQFSILDLCWPHGDSREAQAEYESLSVSLAAGWRIADEATVIIINPEDGSPWVYKSITLRKEVAA